MTIHFSAFTGKVQKVETYGKAVKVTLVHIPRKDSGYVPTYVEAIWKADSFDGKLAMSLQNDDEGVQVLGETQRKKWAKGDGYSTEMPFPRLEVPWPLRKRFLDAKDGAPDPDPTNAAGIDVDTDIPF